MNAENIKRAIDAGVAFRRRLPRGRDLVWIPDQEFAVVLLTPPNRPPLFDFTKCRRLSRGKARKCVALMTDAPLSLKQFYLNLINERQGGEE